MFAGTWYVVPTPFDASGDVDLASLRQLIEAVSDWGVDGLTVMGVTSEAVALSYPERQAALYAIFDANRASLPIVVGCSAGSPQAVWQLMDDAKEYGAEAAMVAPPPLLKNVGVLPDFYAAVSAGALPVVLQDEPNATGVRMPTATVLAAHRAGGCAAIKLEDPPTPPKIGAILESNPDARVFGGLGGTQLLGELNRGSVGSMTGFSYPEILAEVQQAWREDPALAGSIFDRYLPLIQFEGQPGVGLAIRKEILRLRGVIKTSHTRFPSAQLDSRHTEELTALLDRLGITPSPDALAVQAGSAIST